MLISKSQNRIEYLLYFISWVYVIKFNLAGFSLFVLLNLIYITTSILSFTLKNRRIYFKDFLILILFSFYIISIPMISGGNLIKILGFLLNFIVIFLAVNTIKEKKYFRRYIYIYALGLLTSGFVSFLGSFIPNIKNFIESMIIVNTVDAFGQLNQRFTGLDLDPNYFALQILIAMSCLLVIIYNDQKININNIVLFLLLMVFGIYSFSKMFILSLILLILITLVSFYRYNIKVAIKFTLIIGVITGIGMYMFYDYFFQIYWLRFFESGTSAEALTTGRVNNWIIFLNEIFSNIKILIFGAGYGTHLFLGKIAHNMYITAFYYMGIIGLLISILFFKGLFKGVQKNVGLGKSNLKILSINLLPLYILLITNIALDSFVMDYFPFHILLVIISLNYSSKSIAI